MTETASEDASNRGTNRRQFLGIAAMIAAGLSASEILGRPLPAAAAVEWYHPFLVRGNITSGYGPRTNPVTGAYQSLHDGIDYSGPPARGTFVRSVAQGTVVEAAAYGGYGTFVRVSHADGYETLYGHMIEGSIAVNQNQKIGASTVLGQVGRTGSSDGDHLHLRLWREGKTQNPQPLIHGAQLALATPGPTTQDERKSNMQLIRILCDSKSSESGQAEYGSTAILTESLGFVRTSTGLGGRAELEAWTAVADALGIPITEKHVDVNGFTLASRF